MTDHGLSPELERLERELTARPREEPPPWLRGRIMECVEIELCRRRSFFDRRVLVAAAAALVWLNLSLSATNSTQGPPGPRELAEPLARQIEQLLPELPRTDARRLAVLYRAGSGLVPCPDLSCRPIEARGNYKAWMDLEGGTRPPWRLPAHQAELVGRRSLGRACPTLLVLPHTARCLRIEEGEGDLWAT